MSKWHEAAFMKESGDDFGEENLHGIPANEESEEFEERDPSIDSVLSEILSAPNYSSAWYAFDKHYSDLGGVDAIPSGSGAFEEWWTNTDVPSEEGVAGPGIPITAEDLQRFLKDPNNWGEVSSLLSNIFYANRRINLTDDALNILIAEGIPQYVDMSGDVELLEGFFGDLDGEDIQAALDHPRLMPGLIHMIKQEYLGKM